MFFGGIFLIFILSLNSKIVDHGLLWTKGVPIYEMHINEKVERFVNIFFMIHHCYQIHCKMHNIDTHVHVKKKQCL
jgi:hypothetical protein